MYSNNSKSARDALCILLDEKEGKEIAFVQFPQCFENLTKNDLYASMMRVGYDVSLYIYRGSIIIDSAYK